MKTEICKIEPDGRVICAIGGGKVVAQWSGSPPEIGKTYDVELSVSAPMVPGDNLIAASGNPPGLHTEGDHIMMTAWLESCDDDGAAVLRLGESLVQIEVQGSPAPVGSLVTARLADLTLYDTNI